MNWKFDVTMQEYQLVYNRSILARIQIVPRKRGGFKVAALVSGIYYGEKKQLRLEKRNQEWVANKKIFTTKSLADTYVARKKEEITRFIKAREKEG